MSNEDNNRAALSVANLESDIKHESVEEKQTLPFNSRVNIRVTSYRNRNHDPEGVSVKAVLDGLVRIGILAADSTKEGNEVTFKSIISKEEKTIIEITEAF